LAGVPHVIEQANVHQCKRLLHPQRNQLVCLTRLGDAGWVLGFISGCRVNLEYVKRGSHVCNEFALHQDSPMLWPKKK
jgi:hypothetical protein